MYYYLRTLGCISESVWTFFTLQRKPGSHYIYATFCNGIPHWSGWVQIQSPEVPKRPISGRWPFSTGCPDFKIHFFSIQVGIIRNLLAEKLTDSLEVYLCSSCLRENVEVKDTRKTCKKIVWLSPLSMQHSWMYAIEELPAKHYGSNWKITLESKLFPLNWTLLQVFVKQNSNWEANPV